MKKQRNKIRYLCLSAIIAALYIVLTLMSNALGLASGIIQCRVSEALCVLPFFTPAAVPGLTIGCLISNTITLSNPIDIIFGTLATFLGAVGARILRKYKWLVPVPTIAANTLIMPFVLKFAFNLGESIWFLAAAMLAGEFISAGVLGILVLSALKKSRLFDKFM